MYKELKKRFLLIFLTVVILYGMFQGLTLTAYAAGEFNGVDILSR